MNKRNILYMFAAVAGLFASAGCEDDRENFMVDDLVSYVASPSVIDVSVLSETHKVSIMKSGKGKTAANVSVSVSDAVIAEWNSKNNTEYTLMPTQSFKLSSDSFTFAEADARKTFEVQWNAPEMVEQIKSGNEVIPLLLSSTGTSVDGKRDRIMIRPLVTKLGMDVTEVESLSPSLDMAKKDTLKAKMFLNLPIAGKDLNITLEVDNSLVASYNTNHGTEHEIAPDGTIYLKEQNILLSAGNKDVEFEYIMDCSKFYKDGEMINFKSFIVPIKIKSVSLEGLKLGETVLYVPIKPLVVHKLIGPWKVLEGAELCYGMEEGRPNWAASRSTDKLVDGNLDTEWCSFWEHDNQFPMSFVFDTGDLHLFKNFKIKDHNTFQGVYREYEIYMAKEYKGADTEWILVAKGKRAYSWVKGGKIYDFPVQNEVIGRYMKFSIMKSEKKWTGDFAHGRGKLCEIFGEGL